MKTVLQSRSGSVLAGAAGAVLLLVGIVFVYSAIQRVETRLALTMGESVALDGIVTEKLTGEQRDRFLPLVVPRYTIRYAFANLEGKMRSGEQEVTRAFFDAAPGQGGPIEVYVRVDSPTIHAVDAGAAFPGIAGLRLGSGLALLGSGGLLGGWALGRWRRA